MLKILYNRNIKPYAMETEILSVVRKLLKKKGNIDILHKINESNELLNTRKGLWE